MAHCVRRRFREMVPTAQLACLFGPRIITPDDETPRRIVEFATLTAALPITDLVQQRRFRGVARDPEHQSTVGAGDCFWAFRNSRMAAAA